FESYNVFMSQSNSEPLAIIILGATGDLTKRKLIPALYHLSKIDALPANTQIYAFARRPYTNQSFVKEIEPAVAQYYRHELDRKRWDTSTQTIQHSPGEFDQIDAYQELTKRLTAPSPRKSHTCLNTLFYFATKPTAHDHIFAHLERVGLSQSCPPHGEWTR